MGIGRECRQQNTKAFFSGSGDCDQFFKIPVFYDNYKKIIVEINVYTALGICEVHTALAPFHLFLRNLKFLLAGCGPCGTGVYLMCISADYVPNVQVFIYRGLLTISFPFKKISQEICHFDIVSQLSINKFFF